MIYLLLLECAIFVCYHNYETLEIWPTAIEDEEKVLTGQESLHQSIFGMEGYDKFHRRDASRTFFEDVFVGDDPHCTKVFLISLLLYRWLMAVDSVGYLFQS